MSGGFFRGTSADQDTRFSNKQAKLLKTQKFAPELDQPVDMKKVNLDVMRPWIATRVTELLGFEDEVLINFVYGLLEGNVVDGKKVQIQLTGFMEKNTGKFMKELWNLLLSAQNNVSGVPQQFLDAKEEEMRKKKAETDSITQEIQKRREKEGRDLEREKHSRMGAEAGISRAGNPIPDSVPRRPLLRASVENRDMERRHSSKTKSRHSESPHSNDQTSVSHRSASSPDRSASKSFSKSRSYSQEGLKSRSASISSESQRHSASPERRHRSPPRGIDSPERRYRSPHKRSVSPRRRRLSPNLRSPLRRRSPPVRRRSTSRSRRRSPSPIRRRSPHAWRRSPSPLRRGSSSQMRRRSPSPRRRRSPSPPQRRSPSPSHRRSPSPMQRRSPGRRKSPSPLRNRSPIRRRSLSPARHSSPIPLRRRSPPYRSPKRRRRSPMPSPRSRAVDSQVSLRQRNRSRSPDRSLSPSNRTRRSLSRDRNGRINGKQSRQHRDEYISQRAQLEKSPDRRTMGRNAVDHSDPGRKISASISRQSAPSPSSRQHDLRVQRDIVPSLASEKSPNLLARKQNISLLENGRSRSLSYSPVKQSRKKIPRHDSPETSREEENANRAREDARCRADYSHKRSKQSPVGIDRKRPIVNVKGPEVSSPDRSAVSLSATGEGHPVNLDLRKKGRELRSGMALPEKSLRVSPSPEEEYGPGRVKEERLAMDDAYGGYQSKKQPSKGASYLNEKQYNEQAPRSSARDDHSPLEDDEYRESQSEKEYVNKSKCVDKSSQLNDIGTDPEEVGKYRSHNNEKRRHKKSENHKRYLDDGAEYDSQMDERKEAKRRRKDEKRQRKEERRQRREERHHKRLERRAGKLEPKSVDTVTPPPDSEENHDDAAGTDADIATMENSHPSDAEETESEQKKLEIELRKKALESLRAKKAINP